MSANSLSQSRMPPIICFRMESLFEEAIERLGFLDTISSDIYQHRDELSKFVGNEVLRTVKLQRELELEYETLIAKRGELKGLANKTQYKRVQEQLEATAKALRDSTQNLVQHLEENPDISGNLIKVQRDRGSLLDNLTHAVRELHENSSFERFLQRVDDDLRVQNRLESLKEKESSLQTEVSLLTSQLSMEKREFKETATVQRCTIAQLKDDLQQMKSDTAENSSYQYKKSAAYVNRVFRDMKKDEVGFEEEIEGITHKIESEMKCHDEFSSYLDDRTDEIKRSTDEWKQRFESDTKAMRANINDCSSQRLLLLEQLNVLRLRKAAEIQEDEARERQLKEAASDAINRERRLKLEKYSCRVIVSSLQNYIIRRKKYDEMQALTKKKKKKKAKE